MYTRRHRAVYGEAFGRRIFLGEGEALHGQRRWRMLCACGGLDLVLIQSVTQGRAAECGWCARRRHRAANSHAWRGFGAVPSTAFTHFRFSAETRGIPFRVTIEDVDRLFREQDGRCALTDVPLIFRPGNRKPGNASLDRKNSAGIYEIGNVWLVTSAVNMGKQSMSVEEFVAMCRAVARKADAR